MSRGLFVWQEQRGVKYVMDAVTLLRALRPDVGGWVTLSPRYWAGRPSSYGWGPGSLHGGSEL